MAFQSVIKSKNAKIVILHTNIRRSSIFPINCVISVPSTNCCRNRAVLISCFNSPQHSWLGNPRGLVTWAVHKALLNSLDEYAGIIIGNIFRNVRFLVQVQLSSKIGHQSVSAKKRCMNSINLTPEKG